MTKEVGDDRVPQERERPKQEYLDGIAEFEQLLDEMQGRFFSEAGTIREIKEKPFMLKDYISHRLA